jgi:hypothetical protein
MEHLKNMKTKLVDCVEKQISGNLEYTNAQELGEAVDMIKDLSEAIYYCTITEAMEGKGQSKNGSHYPAAHYYGGQSNGNYPTDYMYSSQPMIYASESNGNSTSYYTPIMYPNDISKQPMGEHHNYPPMMYASNGGNTSYMYHSGEGMYPPTYVEHDGRSYVMKRRYMDGRRYNDKQTQMQDLEKYAQELTNELTDMIKDASPEEKTLLQQKINMLASKIK